MQTLFENYIQSISSKFSHKETSEMGYRADFEILLKGIFESINVKRINHDARAEQGNKPDFVVLKGDVPIVYIEAKDIGVSLDKVEKSEQMARYYGYANLVLTDYVEFRFYRNGIRYEEPIKIAGYDLKSRTIAPIPEQYEHVAKTLLDFTQSHKEPIRSGEHLAKIMGGKAQRIRDNVRQFLAVSSDKNAELVKVYKAIKELLVHDLTPHAFADMYAQTVVYGLFAARFHDKTQKDFSRQEAGELIPQSNRLLRDFFNHIVGPNFDRRLEYIINELCEVFSHADIQELMKEYFKTELNDLRLNFGTSGICTAFLLRKILEKLTYIVFARNGIESKIEDKNSPGSLVGLEKMLSIAEKEKIQGIPILTPKTAKKIQGIKFLGDASAHNPLVNVDMETIVPQMPYIITAYKELAERL